MLPYTYTIYIVSLLICLVIYTPKLKMVSILKVGDSYTIEYLNIYGLYVIITNLYMALIYGFGFILYSTIPIFTHIPFDIFFLSESMLQVIQSVMVSNVIMLPISWVSYLLYSKCFENTYDTKEEAERNIEIWVVIYSLCSFALFGMTRELCAHGIVSYRTYVSSDNMIKTVVFMVLITAIACINGINSKTETLGECDYCVYKKYAIYSISLIGTLFFIR
jgi:hypothetical protein